MFRVFLPFTANFGFGTWDSDIIFNPNYSENQAFVTGASVVNKVGDGNFIYVNFKVNKITSVATDLWVDVKQLRIAKGIVTKVFYIQKQTEV